MIMRLRARLSAFHSSSLPAVGAQLAASKRGLLDAAAHTGEGVAGQLHDTEGVQHRGGVGQLAADRVHVAAERVKRGMLDADRDCHTLVSQPVGVDLAGAALDGVEESSVQAAVCVAGEVDHDRDGPVVLLIFEGRQMCSSTPRVFTPVTRPGSPMRHLA